MQADRHLLTTRRPEIRILLDRLTYAREGPAQQAIRERLRQAITEARRVRQILRGTAPSQ